MDIRIPRRSSDKILKRFTGKFSDFVENKSGKISEQTPGEIPRGISEKMFERVPKEIY